MNRKVKISIGIFALIIMAVVFFKFNSKDKSLAKEVNTMALERQNMESFVKGSGKISSIDQREIMSNIEEKIEKIYVKTGDTVEKGQTLIKLDETNLNYKIRDASLKIDMEKENLAKLQDKNNFDLEMDIANLKIKYEDAREEYERNMILEESGAIGKVELNKSKANMDQINNDYLTAQNKLANVDDRHEINLQNQRILSAQMELDKLKSELGNYIIKSPISGTIVDMSISESGVVQSNTKLITIENMNNLELIMKANEFDTGRISLGDPVTISSDFITDKTYTGEVKWISDIAKPSDNGKDTYIEMKISIPDSDKQLKPGTNAKADILVDKKENVFVLPYEAVKRDNDKASILIVEDGLVKELEVTTGLTTDFEIEVIGDLEEGILIVLNPSDDINIGDEIITKGKGGETHDIHKESE